jgi:hypothetical protein
MKTFKNVRKAPLILALALTVFSTSSVLNIGSASAAASPMAETVVRLDRLAYTTATGGNICAKTSSATVETKVSVTFPTNSATDYVLSPTLTNWAATGVTDPSLGATTAWPGLSSTSATTVSGKTVTWASNDLTAGTLYCFHFAGGLTTANNNIENVTGNVTTADAGSNTDVGNFSLGLAAGAAGQGDQIAITGATVPPIFTFALSGNTDVFASNLSLIATTATAGKSVTVSTNAANGYVVWAKDTYNSGSNIGALKSTTANAYLVGAAAVGSASRTLANGTQDYGMGVTVTTNGSGSTAPLAAYDGTANKVGSLDPTGFQPIAKTSASTASDVMSLIERATISTSTKAANDYADTITVVGAGLF